MQEKDCLAVISGSTLTFEVDGEVYTVKKSSKKVTTFKGEIFYRERIQLPPKVNVRYALYKNGETVPFALYFIPTAGRTPLPFSFDCVVNSGDKISVSATIAHENMPLFTTPEPVPAAFLSAQGDVIFLEKNNLAIVKKQNAFSIAHWAQIDRNHNLELIQRNDVPVTAKIQDENTFIFSQFEDKKGISFSRILLTVRLCAVCPLPIKALLQKHSRIILLRVPAWWTWSLFCAVWKMGKLMPIPLKQQKHKIKEYVNPWLKIWELPA